MGGKKRTMGHIYDTTNPNGYLEWLKGPNTQHSGHNGHFFQTELMIEIHSKSLVRANW